MARKRKRREEEAGFGEATAGFTDDPAAPTRERLTPVDVQQKVFRLAFRGYNERDVDEFLDQVTEDLAALHEENKRLREQIAEGGTGTGPEGGAAARQQAEAIVRQAREHAARLIGDAERRVASAGAGAGVSAAPSSYLVREREFLQTLASLVQEHARTLKEEAQQARAAAARTKEEKEEQPQPEQRPSTPASEEAAAAAATTGTAAGTPPPTPSGTPGARGTPGTPGTEEPEMTEGGASRGASSEASDASSDPGARAVVIPPAASETEAEAHSPVKVETASASTAEGPSEAAADRTEGGEPLLSAWETAFSDEDETPSRKEDQARRGDRERSEEPSLRELFWGEE
jgi:cell division initiation protein